MNESVEAPSNEKILGRQNRVENLSGLGNRQEIFRNISRATLPIPSRKPQILALWLSENFLQFT
jgi:hypothetical protein